MCGQSVRISAAPAGRSPRSARRTSARCGRPAAGSGRTCRSRCALTVCRETSRRSASVALRPAAHFAQFAHPAEHRSLTRSAAAIDELGHAVASGRSAGTPRSSPRSAGMSITLRQLQETGRQVAAAQTSAVAKLTASSSIRRCSSSAVADVTHDRAHRQAIGGTGNNATRARSQVASIDFSHHTGQQRRDARRPPSAARIRGGNGGAASWAWLACRQASGRRDPNSRQHCGPQQRAAAHAEEHAAGEIAAAGRGNRHGAPMATRSRPLRQQGEVARGFLHGRSLSRMLDRKDSRAAAGCQASFTARGAAGYLLLTYFSRRICGTGRPAAFSASKQASTMFGLPHR